MPKKKTKRAVAKASKTKSANARERAPMRAKSSKPLAQSSQGKYAKAVLINEYAKTLAEIKKKIQEAQLKATISANKEMLIVYWSIGEIIVERQKKYGWGSGIIEELANDLQKEFPGIGGFSRSNMFRMRAFFLAYEKVSEAPRLFDDLSIFHIPWWHNVILLTKLKDVNERLWYAQKTIENGWSGNILELRIDSNLYKRQGKAITNFHKTLPAPQSDLAQQSFKDPYLVDFLTLRDEYVEKEVEQGLIDHIQKFLLELGEGFAFVGRQVHLNVGDTDYYIDLLFYHFRLRCFIVVELKAGKFDPRDVGQINFYLSAVDSKMRLEDDKPTIGLLLCKTKDNVTAEYALRNINSPIGISAYTTKIVEELPKNLKGSLPSVEEIEAGLEKLQILTKEKHSIQAKKLQKKKKS